IHLLGIDLSNWELRVADGHNGWKLKDGVLSNTAPSVDLFTKDTFRDFKLHIEYKLPAGSNSGIYLRGRYEIQVSDAGDRPLSERSNSAIYGFIAPSEMAANPPGEWNAYDITLNGRTVTAVLNGKKIIDQQVIPGITGGAIDSREASAGPLMLQGDHKDVEYRNITITPALSYKLLEEAGEGAVLSSKSAVKLGVDVLFEKRMDLIKGKRVGLITNPTGVDGRLRSTADLLASSPDVNLVALFGPEHGIRGGASGAQGDSIDANTNVPAYSLYGSTRQPTKEMLKDVEVLLFDIQDIGSRSYTFISTMKHSMDSAAENKVKFVVLDRPNPVNGMTVEGPMIEPEFYSFIGVGPIAYLHGMTVGELAQFFDTEMNIHCDLEVVKMEGWKRDMTWRDTGLVWIPTSPHIPEWDSSWFYPITGIFGETPLVSIGVGYTLPFKLVGAPWMNAIESSKAMNDRHLPGVYFEPFYFTPLYRHFQGEPCEGFRIVITDEKKIRPVEVGYHITEVLMKMYPEQFDFKKSRNRGLDLSNGSDKIRLMFQDGVPVKKIIESYQPGVNEFVKKREKYLLY
ncbi:MAG: exo-beta-N-acetylmuramidase NamZ domain-containing protein, partial [bacterium]